MTSRPRSRWRDAEGYLGEGWSLLGHTSGGHLRYRHGPTGAVVVISPRSGDRRALENMARDARRAVREALQRGGGQ